MNIIAIDGPSGVGKSSLRVRLGEHFGFETLDTGALYRAVTFLMLEEGLPAEDSASASAFAAHLGEKYDLTQMDSDKRLRSDAVNASVSIIAKDGAVRAALFGFQADFAHNYAARGAKGAVLDGRDIGTVIAPDAPAKIFLTASAEVRAQRRFLENKQKGLPGSFEEILANITERDRLNANRKIAPTRAAADALVIDSSELNAEEVFKIAQEFCESNLPG